MSRRLSAAFLALLLVSIPLLASPLEKPMREVERIRGLTFLHDVDSVAGMGLHSVAEGEATLVMLAEMSASMGVTVDQIAANDMLLNAMSTASAAMAETSGTPRYFVESLAFPYTAGLKFVVTGYRK